MTSSVKASEEDAKLIQTELGQPGKAMEALSTGRDI